MVCGDINPIENRGHFIDAFRSHLGARYRAKVALRSHLSYYVQFIGGKMYPKILNFDHL